MAYDAFISYASLDGKALLDIAFAEEAHRRLTAAGFRVWFDKARLNPGCDWHREIEAGCEASRVLLPVLTPRWKLSDWTKFETYGAEAVIPLIVEGEVADIFTPPLTRFQGQAIRLDANDEAAWERVLAGLRDLLAQPAPEKTARLALVPYAHNPYFVGREQELLELHEKLSRAPSTVLTQGTVQAVAGMGGIGKTTLAREYAEKFWRLYRHILWVRADRPLVFEFQRLAEELGLTRERSQDPEIDARLALRELSSRTRRLLILDNAPDEEAIQEWIPTTGDCRTIITSRFAGWSAAVQTLHVYVLEPEPARELLLNRSGLPDTEDQRAAADLVAKELGYLPLALEHAAAFVREAAVSFDQYLEYHAEAKSRRDLLARRVLGSTQYPDAVATTWLVTIQRLGPLARAILTLISFLAPDDIPRSLVTKAGDLLREGVREFQPADAQSEVEVALYFLDQALVELNRYSMITLRPENLFVHRLVQAVQRDGLAEPALNRWAECAVRVVERAFPGPEFSNWQICERLLSHAWACQGFIKSMSLQFFEAGEILNKSGLYLDYRGQYVIAKPLLQQALEIARTTFGERHLGFAASLQNLAALYYEMGDYAAAEPLFQQDLEITRTLVGGQDIDFAQGLNSLAELYHATGKYEAAEPLYRQASEIVRTALGEQHPDFALNLNNLAELYRATGKYEAAEPLYRQASEIQRTALGEQHPDFAGSLNNLAELYRATGKYEAAEPLLRQASEIYRTALGEQHPHFALSLNNLSLLYYAMGNYTAAEEQLLRAVRINEASSDSHYLLARVYQGRGGLGDKDRETAEWERYLELGPTSEGRRKEAVARLDKLSREGEL